MPENNSKLVYNVQSPEQVECPAKCGHVFSTQEYACLEARGLYKCPNCQEIIGYEDGKIFRIR